MPPDFVLAELNAGRYRKLGRLLNSRFERWLLWDPYDDDFYVVAVKTSARVVLTLLSVSMVLRSSSILTDREIQRVINKLVYDGIAPRRHWLPTGQREEVNILARITERPEPIRLGRYATIVTSRNLARLAAEPRFLPWVAEHATRRGLDLETICGLEAFLSSFAPQPLDLSTLGTGT